MIKIEATYCDKAGEIITEMTNDGSEIKISLDGVEFISNTLDDFEQVIIGIQNDRFEFDKNGILTSYTLAICIPIKYQVVDLEKETTLNCKIQARLSNSGYNVASSTGTIQLNDEIIEIGEFDLFENLFVRLNKRLNSDTHLNCCFNCQYADYSVYGQGFWGTMLCFKNSKSEYVKVKDKDEYMSIMDHHEQLVQETFLCREFERRIPGTGYRG